MATNKKQKREVYWAGPDSDTRDCGDAVMKRIEDYYTWCYSSGWMTRWNRLYTANYANTYTGGTTVSGGDNGEYRVCYVNHFNSLLEHVQTLSITDRPAWQPQATNNDAQSQKQTLIATWTLDYYMREKRVERHLHDAVRNALLFCEGFVEVTWDSDLGDALAEDQDTGEQKRQGDLKVRSHEPVDVIRDPSLQKFYDRNWVVVRNYDNKFDIAEKYPEYAEEIISQKWGLTEKNHYLGGRNRVGSSVTDQIVIYNFYHGKTASCPEGRQMTLLEDGTILTDSILLYDKIPLHRIVPEDQIGTPMGKSVSTDLLPIQEMIDSHYTTILSTNENYGIPKILLPVGSNIQADNLSAGFDIINYNNTNGKPEVMAMPQTPNSIGATLQQLIAEAQTISGVNAVSRGTPPPSLQSGSALALVQSMAVQFNAPLQQSYIGLLEDVGTAIINILKDYADTERVIQISGQKNKSVVQTGFSKEDLTSISRVQVQAGNAMSKTISGRLAMAQDLLQNKIIQTPREYLMVLETGNLEPLTQGPTMALLNLSSENEMLLDGQQVPVLFTDDHVTHIQEHTALASDPMVRMDPMKLQVITQHLQEHMQFLTDPQYQQYMQLMGQPNLAQPQGGMPGPQGQGQAPKMPSVNPRTQTPGVMQPNGATPASSAAIQQKAASITPAKMPVNPLNGQRPPNQPGV